MWRASGRAPRIHEYFTLLTSNFQELRRTASDSRNGPVILGTCGQPCLWKFIGKLGKTS
jgi:hypothetical protein